jgi:hypothetical protein
MYADDADSLCNVVQQIPRDVAMTDRERLIARKADPVLPRPAVISLDSCEFHTHEVSGSSPEAPTT